MTKPELRKLFLEKRRALTASEILEASQAIANRFFGEFGLVDIKTLHCYISIPKLNEVDTSLIVKKIWQEFPHVRTVAPRLDRASDALEHVVYGPKTTLVENSWGISEPAGATEVDPYDIDLVLVPLLCFDRRGFRVGYGKGYYDRFLAQCRHGCPKIGLSLFGPVDSIDDIYAGDVPLDFCILPERLVTLNTPQQRNETNSARDQDI